MKVGVIGAGISGMSIARLIDSDFEVEILEKESVVGGIARTKDVNGIAYHIVGGHCFNSIYPEVLNFIFDKVLSKDNWNLIERQARALFRDQWISYPVEFAISEIDKIDSFLGMKIVQEMLNASYEKGSNLEEWFINHFGPTLSREYFLPYNEKIWGINPKEMDNSWIIDEKQMKLPVPTKMSFYKSLLNNSKNVFDNMPHAFYYYPKTNNQNTFIDALSVGLKIIYNYQVKHIEYFNKKWYINGEKQYDILINTSPLDLIPNILQNIPSDIINSFKKLKFNKISNMLWETDGSFDSTWAYVPNKDIGFHRLLNIGTYFRPIKNYCITESVGEKTYEHFVNEGKKINFLKRPVDFHVSDRAYICFDLNYVLSKTTTLKYLESIGLISHGRFAEWEYYNMDVCIKRSIDLAKKIKSEYLL
ncbi:NAD(P)-binding protein [Campylobacter coli]|nr:NAD(P)-binding protein [Campylobacter coli]